MTTWPSSRTRSFRDDDERVDASVFFAVLQGGPDLVVIERDLRNQNDMRASRDPAVQRDPARVTAHHLQDHDPLVTRRRGVQAIERIHHGGHGGIKTERHRGRGKIVVDRLRHADAVDAGLLQLQRRRHGAVAADDDERFHPQILQALLRGRDDLGRDLHAIPRAYFRHKMSAIGRAENGSAARHDPAGSCGDPG